MPPGKCSSACAQSLEMQDALPVSVVPVVVFACGNPSRGDDALGPLLLDQLQIWLDEEGLADGFELISDFQWQIEHALDLVCQCAAFSPLPALDRWLGGDDPCPWPISSLAKATMPPSSTYFMTAGAWTGPEPVRGWSPFLMPTLPTLFQPSAPRT